MKFLGSNTDGGKPKYSQRNLSHCHMCISTTNPTLTNLVLNSSLCAEQLTIKHPKHTEPITL
jgi:hypothetical protein